MTVISDNKDCRQTIQDSEADNSRYGESLSLQISEIIYMNNNQVVIFFLKKECMQKGQNHVVGGNPGARGLDIRNILIKKSYYMYLAGRTKMFKKNSGAAMGASIVHVQVEVCGYISSGCWKGRHIKRQSVQTA